MPEIRYSLTEYHPDRPWLVVNATRHLTAQLPDGQDFTTWAARTWPAPRYRAELVPDTLGPWQGAS